MIVTIVGFLIVVLAANYIAWPMLRGASEAAPEAIEPSALQKEKNAALEAIGEVDWDHRIGKISDDDHAELRRNLEDRALAAMAQLQESEPSEPAKVGFCPGCGIPGSEGARFCTGCGKQISGSAAGADPIS